MFRGVVVAVAAGVVAPAAFASGPLTDVNLHDVTLQVNAKGEALISYVREDGRPRHVLAWGAVNALPPTVDVPQVRFAWDYAGGWRKYHDASYWRHFRNVCRPYDGPALPFLVVACKAPDGSYWAVQSWQRDLPDYGVAPTPTQASWEVHLAHWSGALPVLTISTDWAWHQWDHIYGSFTYDGHPVYGFKSTSVGAPLDTFGRNLYVDTFDSKYGSGWIRENSFLTHTNTGVFCYSFNPHGTHPAGNGTKYRATILGPGVTPDIMWEGVPPGPYDKAADETANQQIAALGDSQCKPN